MFDYLGTFTVRQLRERHAYLRAQVHAFPDIIRHLEKKLERLVGRLDSENATSFGITYSRGDRSYNLGQVSVPKVAFEGSNAWSISRFATINRYPQRVDPLTRDVTIGDNGWRPYGRLLEVRGLNQDMDDLSYDDQVPAVYSEKTLRPFRSTFKRPEYLEEKGKKVRYRALLLQDEIDEKTQMLEEFESQLAFVEELLNNQLQITDSAGESKTVSEYDTAGIETKTDVTNPEDVERLLDLFLPSSTPKGDTDEEADSPAQMILPAVPSDIQELDVPASSPPGEIAAFREEFPLVGNLGRKAGQGIVPRDKLQLMANIWAYGFDQMVEIPDTEAYFVKHAGAYPYAPPNVAQALTEYCDEIFNRWGVQVRIVELFPATWPHQTFEHWTGNAVDITFSTDGQYGLGRNARIDGVAIGRLADIIIRYGQQQGYIRNGLNEYVKKTKFSGGPHVHLNFEPIYFNGGNILTLGRQ